MSTYLLGWNPSRWPWGEFQDELAQMRRAGSLASAWSVGNHHIVPGDRLFLIRLGVEPRGIVGSGRATSQTFTDKHWDQDRAAEGKTATYVELMFDSLYKEPPLPVSALGLAPLGGFRWGIQMSGVSIPEEIAEALEEAWASATGNEGVGFPDENASPEAFPEGAATRVYSNRYERNPAARARCLAHYGLQCCVCEMTFEERYGPLAASFIQVHHLNPLADVGAEYEVDPIRDLRPICPNCHSVVHLMKPPMSVYEARQLVEARRSI